MDSMTKTFRFHYCEYRGMGQNGNVLIEVVEVKEFSAQLETPLLEIFAPFTDEIIPYKYSHRATAWIQEATPWIQPDSLQPGTYLSNNSPREHLNITLNKEGGVRFWEESILTYGNLTLGECYALYEAGLLSLRPENVYILMVEGAGATSGEHNLFVDFVVNVANTITLGIFNLIFMSVKKYWNKKTVRKKLAKCRELGFFYVFQVRETIERKNRWEINELVKFLDSNIEECSDLLKMLGYSKTGGSYWVKKNNLLSRLRHNYWLKLEIDWIELEKLER